MSLSKKSIEQAAGIFAFFFFCLWLLESAIKVLDAISRVQTLITLGPYLPMLGTWWGQSALLLAAALLFIWATRLEQERENDASSKIYLPGVSHDGKPGVPPPKPKRRWFWAKLAAFALALVSLIAVGDISIGHFRTRSVVIQTSPPPQQPTPTATNEPQPGPARPQSSKHGSANPGQPTPDSSPGSPASHEPPQPQLLAA